MLKDLVNLRGDPFRSWNTCPSRVDTIEDPASVFDRLPVQKFEIFFSLAALDLDAESLTFVHAPAGRGDLGIRLAEERLIAAGFEADQTGRIEGLVARLRAESSPRIPEQPARLPRLYKLELLWKTFWIRRRAERFLSQAC